VTQEHFIRAIDKVRNRIEKRRQLFGTHI
jgi:proteasome regulatory subunit